VFCIDKSTSKGVCNSFQQEKKVRRNEIKNLKKKIRKQRKEKDGRKKKRRRGKKEE